MSCLAAEQTTAMNHMNDLSWLTVGLHVQRGENISREPITVKAPKRPEQVHMAAQKAHASEHTMQQLDSRA